MERLTRAWMLFTLGWLAATVFGCGALQSDHGPTIDPISSFSQVAGKWEGLSKRIPDMQKHAWVLLDIGDKGTFTVVSNRGTTILLGAGSLTPIEGQLFGKTSLGSGTFTLHKRGDQQILVVEVALNDGNHYYLEMTRVR